jgi:hypothetical protein
MERRNPLDVSVGAVCPALVAVACSDDDTAEDTVSTDASAAESAPTADAPTDDDSGESAGVELPTAPMSEADTALIDEAAMEGLTTTALTVADDFDMVDPSSAGYVNEFAAAAIQAEGVEVEPLGDVSSYNPNWGGTGGSMYSTIEDLGTCSATGLGNELVPPELAAQRLEAGPLAEGIDDGLGLIDFGNGWYGHTGDILGWNSIAAHQPDSGATYVAFVNESGSLLATVGPALAAFPDLTGAYGLE